ncbi:MAG: hypothetical protein U0599_08945 [Vicinamibacteria bacterium]
MYRWASAASSLESGADDRRRTTASSASESSLQVALLDEAHSARDFRVAGRG